MGVGNFPMTMRKKGQDIEYRSGSNVLSSQNMSQRPHKLDDYGGTTSATCKTAQTIPIEKIPQLFNKNIHKKKLKKCQNGAVSADVFLRVHEERRDAKLDANSTSTASTGIFKYSSQ